MIKAIKENRAETIDLTPTWVVATRIYIAVLKNPNASFEALQDAEEELLELAAYVDRWIEHNKLEK